MDWPKEKIDHLLEEHPTIVPLFEIDVISTIGSPIAKAVTEEVLTQAEPDPTTIAKLLHA